MIDLLLPQEWCSCDTLHNLKVNDGVKVIVGSKSTMTSWSMLFHMWCEAEGRSCKFDLSFKGDGIIDETKSWIVVQSLNVHMKFEYWTQEYKHEGDRVQSQQKKWNFEPMSPLVSSLQAMNAQKILAWINLGRHEWGFKAFSTHLTITSHYFLYDLGLMVPTFKDMSHL
jgi:hypothetical protein